MTAYQEQHVQDKTMEEYEGNHTNYFGSTYKEEDSLEETLNNYFQKAE